MSHPIAKLERLPLRAVWPHEAYDFSRWLQANIELLNEELGLRLADVTVETPAGSFSIDLVAQDESGGTVILENQLGPSDHDHLGKLITYLTGVEARAAIWIVAHARPEHVAAVTWLNETSSADFYMVKVEAVRIGDSPPAPLFTLIVGPSEEARQVGRTRKELHEGQELRKRWWTRLIERSTQVTSLHAHITPSTSGWIGVSAGLPGLTYVYVATQKTREVELYINRSEAEENLQILEQLRTDREEIEAKFGAPLKWQPLEGRNACRIRYTMEGGGYGAPEEEWPTLQDEAIQAMNRLERTLRPYLPKLRTQIA